MPDKENKLKRQDHEPPAIIAHSGWRFHHIGIPTAIPRPNETYLTHLKIHVSGFETSPYGVEWMRFDEDCGLPEIIRTTPHIAFEVDNLESALVGQTILYDIGSPSKGVRTAMIIDNGAPIELIEFQRDSGS